MIDYNREDQFLRQRLQKEIPILRALIQNLYEELDRKLHLNGAKVPKKSAIAWCSFKTDTKGVYLKNSFQLSSILWAVANLFYGMIREASRH